MEEWSDQAKLAGYFSEALELLEDAEAHVAAVGGAHGQAAMEMIMVEQMHRVRRWDGGGASRER